MFRYALHLTGSSDTWLVPGKNLNSYTLALFCIFQFMWFLLKARDTGNEVHVKTCWTSHLACVLRRGLLLAVIATVQSLLGEIVLSSLCLHRQAAC